MTDPWNKGKKGLQYSSEETKQKQSLSHLGKKYKPMSVEGKRNISIAKKGRIGIWLGKHLSEEHKRSISITKKLKMTEELKQKLREARLKLIFPKKDTLPERIAQQALIDLKIPFSTHKSILGQPDIFIEPNICIFIDGDYWHSKPSQKEKDTKINQKLVNQGYSVYRLWEYEIMGKNKRMWVG